jgi:hypothetical protein
MDLALNLSTLSEEEAFALALKQSMMSFERKETPKRAPAYSSSDGDIMSYNSEKSSKKLNSEQADEKWDNAAEEAELRAALNASLMGGISSSSSSSSFNNSNTPLYPDYEDEDEMLRRAIAESLK